MPHFTCGSMLIPALHYPLRLAPIPFAALPSDVLALNVGELVVLMPQSSVIHDGHVAPFRQTLKSVIA
jgi:hypothetical protein